MEIKKKSFNIAVFAADGISSEIMREALKVLRLIAEKPILILHLRALQGLRGKLELYTNLGPVVVFEELSEYFF
ncbi:MAG: hypothetical protein HGA29_08030 [Syntrophaceae bacterium]|nr:hypothetical protein [Syntrophaceae bacterium]